MNAWGWLAWGILLPAQLMLLMVMLVTVFQFAELIWRQRLKPRFAKPGTHDAELPMVSLHLAICNEPPDVVKATLNSLAALDYPNFEVLVLDNNTRDAATGSPSRPIANGSAPASASSPWASGPASKRAPLTSVSTRPTPAPR